MILAISHGLANPYLSLREFCGIKRGTLLVTSRATAKTGIVFNVSVCLCVSPNKPKSAYGDILHQVILHQHRATLSCRRFIDGSYGGTILLSVSDSVT